MTLNKEKCQFYTNLLGHIVDESPETEAIINTPRPTNVQETRRFLGMLNQLSKFSPNLAEKTIPLRELLSKKRQWYWGDDQEKAFQDLKATLCSGSCLALFNPKYQTTVSADASAYGLGAVLRQRQQDGTLKPVVYIFRSRQNKDLHRLKKRP